jgi:hypothetical protein
MLPTRYSTNGEVCQSSYQCCVETLSPPSIVQREASGEHRPRPLPSNRIGGMQRPCVAIHKDRKISCGDQLSGRLPLACSGDIHQCMYLRALSRCRKKALAAQCVTCVCRAWVGVGWSADRDVECTDQYLHLALGIPSCFCLVS